MAWCPVPGARLHRDDIDIMLGPTQSNLSRSTFEIDSHDRVAWPCRRPPMLVCRRNRACLQLGAVHLADLHPPHGGRLESDVAEP
jgi:hypothetical protein